MLRSIGCEEAPLSSFVRFTRRWLISLALVLAAHLLPANFPPGEFSVFRAAQAQDEEAKRRQELLPHYLPRIRRLKEMLTSVDHQQTTGRTAEAIKTVQWILDQPHDVFVIPDAKDKRPPQSVRKLAEAKLRAFPPDWRKQYERTYGVQARQLLEDAQHRDDDRLAVEVLRRFGVTPAADEAAIWLALRWLDRGDPEAALAVLIPDAGTSQLLADMPTARLSAAHIAAAAAGNQLLFAAIGQVLEDRADPNGDKERPQPTPAPANGPASQAEVLTVSNEVDGMTRTRDAVPVLRPRWTAPLATLQSSPHLPNVLDAWRSNLQETNFTPVTPQLPLVIRDQVIVRNFEGLCGIDLASGRTLWTFPCESSISGWIDEAARHRRLEADAANAFTAETLQWWFSSNTQMEYLASDGIRLFAIDSLAPPSWKPGQRQDQFQARSPETARIDEANRLLALELPTQHAKTDSPLPRILWSYGRSQQADGALPQDRFFFGPPLPSAGRLLSIAETDREVRVMALQAETGAVLWEQPIASVDRSAIHDGERAFTACVPVIAGGLLICPTQAGVLAAVESATGTLRWSYFDGDVPAEPVGNRQRAVITTRGRPGFASRTLVQGDRIVHLPNYSSAIHCVDRETGRMIWTKPRLKACTIAAVMEELVVLLEDSACRGLKLSDGTEAWRQPLPSVVGTGLRIGANYLVPLDQGRFSLFELSSGRQLSWQPPRAGISLGNLTACGDVVLSCNPTGITAFPQSQFVRKTLNDKSITLAEADLASLKIDLDLADGNLTEAERYLERSLAAAQDPQQQGQLNGLLRELLYHQLSTPSDKDGVLLGRLKQLATTPEERGRYLARRAHWAMKHHEMPSLRQALDEFAQLSPDIIFPSADDPAWKQSAAACCRQMLAELEREEPEFVRSFRDNLLERMSRDEEISGWRFALRVLGEDPAADRWRDSLAQRLEDHRQFHAAELLWLRNRHHEQPAAAADALVGLAGLWTAAGWPRDAVPILNELAGPLADAKLKSDRTGWEYVEELSPDDDARQWRTRIALPRGRVVSAAIHPAADLELSPADFLTRPKGRNNGNVSEQFRYGEFARRLTPNDPLTADVLVRVQGQNSSLVVIDKGTSQIVRTWSIPSRHSHPWPGNPAFQAHFLPIGVPGELRGYSLLQLAEDVPAWTQRPAELDRRRVIPSVGPGNASFVVFQAQNMLFVCDPWDGSILWQRNDLEPNSGLYADPNSGIAGDECCLVVFAADRLGYTTYDTMTGQKQRSGRLDLEPRQLLRRAFGRKIFSVPQIRGSWQARVWDPLDDKWELKETLGERNLATNAVGSSEIGWLTSEGRLRIYDVPAEKRMLDLLMTSEELEGLNAIRFISDGDRYYLNFQRNMPAAQTREYNYPAGDTVIPCLHVRDDIYGIDRKTGRIAWKRTVPSRTLLRLDPPGLPFLVLLSRVRDKNDNNQQSLLVEVLDADTGELLGRQEHLTADRIVNADYDGVEQTLRLVGQRSGIEIRLAIGNREE